MVYIWYQNMIRKANINQNNTTNKVNLYTNAETKNYDYEVRLVGESLEMQVVNNKRISILSLRRRAEPTPPSILGPRDP